MPFYQFKSVVETKQIKLFNFKMIISVANQFYQSSSEEEYVIVGNDAIVKCKIPSFVADFVTIVSWQDNQDNVYYQNNNIGNWMLKIIDFV